MSTLLACYSNAGNLGIPVAAYALGDVTWVAPILVIQMVVLQPVALAILDLDQARREGATVSVSRLVTLPLRNPLTVGVLLGLAVNLIHGRLDWFVLPQLVARPVDMVGAIAVPLMLLAFGVSLRLDPKPDRGPDQVESWLLAATKVIFQPLVAYLLAAWVLHLTPVAVRAVTVVACLPPAQNIFIFASKYNVRMVFARDTIFRATFCSIVVVLLAAVVLA
jgi:predicted permease